MQCQARSGQLCPISHSDLDKIREISPLRTMIRKIIALYRARNNSPLAKRLAGEMIIEGTIDRASWPLTIAKFWISIGILVISGLILAFLLIGTVTHWSLAIPVLPLGAAIYALIRIWRGFNAGVEYVTALAKAELGKRTDKPTPNSSATVIAPRSSI